jgi:Xaa-Pro aminopeptidase
MSRDSAKLDGPMGTHPCFTFDEFATRVAQLRQHMRAAEVDIALFDEIEAMTWLTGYGNSENRWRCVGIPLEGEPFFLIRALDATPCRQRSWIDDVPTFRDWEDPMPVLHDALARRGLAQARIGLDYNSYCMPVARFARVQAALPGAHFVDLGNLVWQLRLIKSPAEIALLRQCAGIADEALRRAAAVCVPGVSQREAARAAVNAFVELGADPGPPGPITAGRGWDFLHGHLEDALLTPGDIVHIELTPRIAGYSARTMRCVSVGAPEPSLAEAGKRLVAIQDRQIAAMRPGAVARDVDAILRRGVLQAGLRDSYDNITGYTLGYYAYPGPHTSDFTRIFHPEADWVIEPGMVFHMYASAAGASLSETVLVTQAGPELLTSLPREVLVNA